MELMDDEEFAQLKRRVAEYRPMNPYIWPATQLCIITGASSSLIRGYFGWSYEEAGFWLNLGFWGCSILTCLVLGPLIIRQAYKDWTFIKDTRKLKERKVLCTTA